MPRCPRSVAARGGAVLRSPPCVRNAPADAVSHYRCRSPKLGRRDRRRSWGIDMRFRMVFGAPARRVGRTLAAGFVLASTVAGSGGAAAERSARDEHLGAWRFTGAHPVGAMVKGRVPLPPWASMVSPCSAGHRELRLPRPRTACPRPRRRHPRPPHPTQLRSRDGAVAHTPPPPWRRRNIPPIFRGAVLGGRVERGSRLERQQLRP